MEVAQGLNIALEARAVAATEARQADEVFITSTAGGVVPVTQVDGHL